MSFSAALKKGKAFLKTGSPTSYKPNLNGQPAGTAATPAALFSVVDPAIDGEDCDHDCASCEIRLPRNWKIDESDDLYGHVNGWATHALVATGKTDWVRDVADEKGSVMEAVGKWTSTNQPGNGKMMLSASNIPLPDSHNASQPAETRPTTVLLLPSFVYIDDVTPTRVPDLMTSFVSQVATTTSPLSETRLPPLVPSNDTADKPASLADLQSRFRYRPCPHDALILICSQQTRDARCGKSAPLLRKELERHLRPLGLQRDLHDTRPGGVGIYFISHVGGHKYSANVMVYRRAGAFQGGGRSDGETSVDLDVNATKEAGGEAEKSGTGPEAAQCIWLARIRPEHCEGLVKFTVLQGKVVDPANRLRGGFDRNKGLVSW